MHDLVHDLATATLADKVIKNGNVWRSSCQYALVRDSTKLLQSSVSSPERLKALHILNYEKIQLSDGAISPAKCLHVLDLRRCVILKFPDSIGQLKQLRYLHAPGIIDWRTPNCISKLSELKYLSLRRSRIKALPDSIGDIKGLMYLDLSDCKNINKLPVSFSELKQLVHLDLSSCSVSVSDSFGGFTKLQYLNLQGHTKVLPEVISKLTKLRYFNLSGLRMSPTAINSLLVAVSALYNLEHLDLYTNYKLTSIPECIGKLTKLHTLNLSDCFEIDELPSCMNKMVSLEIVHMHAYVLKISKVECSSNLVLLEKICPHKLKINRLENVILLEEAESIKLILKRSLLDLTLEWTVGCGTRILDDKDVLDKLVPPNTIGSLRVTGYRSPSFPTNWLMVIGQYLPKLRWIILGDFPNCNNLAPLGQLPNLHTLHLHRLGSLEELNTGDSCGELIFPMLYELDIKSCPKLRMKSCLLRALRELSIEASDNMLTSLGECLSEPSVSSSSSQLTSWGSGLRKLDIMGCSDLASFSPGVIQHLSSLKSLKLKDDILTELPTWLLELTSLQRLIRRAPKLEKLNGSTGQLTTGLESLFLVDCRSMVSLPQWLGELTSLTGLYICRCQRIRSLPGSIRQLTMLETLQIDSYQMDSYRLRQMLSLIPADTDEVDIDEASPFSRKQVAEASSGSRINNTAAISSDSGLVVNKLSGTPGLGGPELVDTTSKSGCARFNICKAINSGVCAPSRVAIGSGFIGSPSGTPMSEPLIGSISCPQPCPWVSSRAHAGTRRLAIVRHEKCLSYFTRRVYD